MNEHPGLETGTTLLDLLNDPSNAPAWSRFVDRYGPRILGWCRRWNLQQADAENVTQDVLTKLYEKLQTYQPEKGRFRGWLKTITQRAWTDYLRSQGRGGRVGEGGTEFLQHLNSVAAGDDLAHELEKEFDREVLEIARQRTQQRVKPTTWKAFQLLTVENKSGAEAAAELDMKVAAIFVAKKRVLTILQEEVRRLENNDPERESQS